MSYSHGGSGGMLPVRGVSDELLSRRFWRDFACEVSDELFSRRFWRDVACEVSE